MRDFLTAFTITLLSASLSAGPAQALLLTKVAGTGGGGGGASGTWYDYVDFSTTDANASIGNVDYVGWVIINLPSGNATKLRMKVGAYTSTTNLKLGLYTGGGTKLAEGVVSVTSTGTFEASITTTAVTSGNHFVAWIAQDASAISSAYKDGVGTLYYGDGAVPSYTLENPIPSQSGTATRSDAVGVLIQ